MGPEIGGARQDTLEPSAWARKLRHCKGAPGRPAGPKVVPAPAYSSGSSGVIALAGLSSAGMVVAGGRDRCQRERFRSGCKSVNKLRIKPASA